MEMRVVLQNIALKFPCRFIFRMMLPLDFVEFHHIVPSHFFLFIQDFYGMLHVRKIRLERKSFNFYCLIGNSQILFQLGDMENIVDC
jgi:hypothetical protein